MVWGMANHCLITKVVLPIETNPLSGENLSVENIGGGRDLAHSFGDIPDGSNISVSFCDF